MKTLVAAVAGTVVLVYGLGIIISVPAVGKLFGISADPFPDTGTAGAFHCSPQQCPPGSKWVKPVPQGIVSGFRGPGRPDHDGTDLGAPRGTTVIAASAGTVTIAECSATLGGGWYGCDQDGSPSVMGCGWHVAIAHAGDLLTVYCHFNEKPFVHVGDKVDTGDPIGLSGTTGNSSGPHMHLEVHTTTVWESASAIDPASFFADRGLPL